jgi:ribose/xylose/arabinose/galactoside ABC-type transport system permease subunit
MFKTLGQVKQAFVDKANIVNVIITMLALLAVLIMAVSVPRFSRLGNIINVVDQLTTMGFLCLGITCVLIVGGIDLSIPSVLMASATTGAMFMINGGSIFLGIIIILGISILLGLINGIAIAKAGMVPFIVTLSTMVVAKGFATMITNGISLFGLPENFLKLNSKIGIIPIQIIIFFVFVAFFHVFLTKTKSGRIFFMIGLNSEAARVSGIPVSKYIILAYIISSIMAGIAGILLVARTDMAGASLVGDTVIMDTISAAVIGGASLKGGRGSALGSVLGALFITLISNFINLMNITYYTGMIIKGTFIVLVIGLDLIRTKQFYVRKTA